MLKKLLAAMAMMFAMSAFAAVDVNKATAAELDSIKGIGPGISTKILDERKKGNFKDWNDFIDRTKGVGDGNAAKFSAEGLTVNGSAFAGAPAAKPAVPAKDAKPAPAPTAPVATAPVTPAAAVAAAPAAKAAPAAEMKLDAKAQAKADKEAAKAAKAEAKMKKAEEMKAKKAAAADAKKAAADAKAAAADAPKAAASAAKK